MAPLASRGMAFSVVTIISGTWREKVNVQLGDEKEWGKRQDREIKHTWVSCCVELSGRLSDGWEVRNSLLDRYMLTSGCQETKKQVNLVTRWVCAFSRSWNCPDDGCTHCVHQVPGPCSLKTPCPWFWWPLLWTYLGLHLSDVWAYEAQLEPTGGPGIGQDHQPLGRKKVQRQRV